MQYLLNLGTLAHFRHFRHLSYSITLNKKMHYVIDKIHLYRNSEINFHISLFLAPSDYDCKTLKVNILKYLIW